MKRSGRGLFERLWSPVPTAHPPMARVPQPSVMNLVTYERELGETFFFEKSTSG